jgi:hypothetical protein
LVSQDELRRPNSGKLVRKRTRDKLGCRQIRTVLVGIVDFPSVTEINWAGYSVAPS